MSSFTHTCVPPSQFSTHAYTRLVDHRAPQSLALGPNRARKCRALHTVPRRRTSKRRAESGWVADGRVRWGGAYLGEERGGVDGCTFLFLTTSESLHL